MLVAEAPAVLVGDNESEIPSGGSFKIGSFINSFLSAPAWSLLHSGFRLILNRDNQCDVDGILRL